MQATYIYVHVSCLYVWILTKYVTNMQINGRGIWSHLVNLYNAKTATICGITLLPKLKLEHIQLTSFSRMKVNLVAQVSSFFAAI